jgi:hypothetical protein
VTKEGSIHAGKRRVFGIMKQTKSSLKRVAFTPGVLFIVPGARDFVPGTRSLRVNQTCLLPSGVTPAAGLPTVLDKGLIVESAEGTVATETLRRGS